MATDVNKEVQSVADKYGQQLVFALRRELGKHDKFASGDLINSLSHTVKSNGSQTVINIFAEDYLRFVDQGRQPNRKMPPDNAKFRQWLAVRNIPLTKSFAIRRSIGIKGIKGLKFVNKTVDKITLQFIPEYEKEMERIIGAVLVNDVFNKTTTKGRIVAKSLTS